MISPQNLAALLRALRGGEWSARATMPATPVQAVTPAAPVAAEQGHGPSSRGATEALPLPPGLAADPARPQTATARAANVHGAAISRAGEDRPARALTSNAPALQGARVAQAMPVATSAAVALSAAGAVLQDALRIPAPLVAAHAIRSAAPLLPGTTVDAAPLAHALEHAVADSGIFYESHVAAWAASEYPREALMREPQAQWAQLHGPATGAALEADPAASAAPAASAMPSEAVTLVRQQLDALDARRFAWTGELWPGQQAAIVFEQERSARERAADHATLDDTRGAWSTEVTLRVPRLGTVIARLQLAGDAVRCRVNAAEPHAADALAHAREDLARAFAAQALRLERCEVSHERR